MRRALPTLAFLVSLERGQPLVGALRLIVEVPNLEPEPSAGTSGSWWRQVGVHSVPLAKETPGTWTSQSGQDRTVHRLLGERRGGFFVDLAANHAVLRSNSQALERDHC